MPSSCVSVSYKFRQVASACCFLAHGMIDQSHQIGMYSEAAVQTPALTRAIC